MKIRNSNVENDVRKNVASEVVFNPVLVNINVLYFS